MNEKQPILPGATLGVFGGGQLGRMFCQAAARMGYRVVVFDPAADCPAGQVAHDHVRADYDDTQALLHFAGQCEAITLEFENVPVAALELAGRFAPTRPGPHVLAAAQDRLLERQFLDRHHLPTAPHVAVRHASDLERAVSELATPFVLKTARLGYDGRGQIRIDQPDQATPAWEQLSTDAALAEAWVDYVCELSVLVARGPGGAVETFGPIENQHVNHILDLSVTPADVAHDVANRAEQLALAVAEAFALEGLICVEMFLTRAGELLINEIAPRPHNSGHLSIEACATSQFEQQVRAMCHLPLGSMALPRPAAMVNLLGDLWQQGEPDWPGLLRRPGVALHLYGKDRPRPGRKMGHLTATAPCTAQARRRVLEAREQLHRSAPPQSPQNPTGPARYPLTHLVGTA